MRPHHFTFLAYLPAILFVIFGFLAGIFYSSNISHFIAREIPSDLTGNKNISYIDPGVDTQKKPIKYVPFELKTSKRIFEEIKIDKTISLSVYVRNLDNGWPWFGIRENELFAPIRSLKMPIFIAYLKWSEEEPDLLNQTIKIEKIADSDGEKVFIPRNKLKVGQMYSVRDLLEEMMVNSNITATEALFKKIPYSFLTKVDTDLGVLLPGEEEIRASISLKEYSSFFRILYTASYLSPSSSQYALSLLTKTDFSDGIRKWVPPDIQIANKFWEKIYIDKDDVKTYQLHDCGIVYYAPYPYIACISAKSKNIEKLRYVIGETSRIIYEEISAAYQN